MGLACRSVWMEVGGLDKGGGGNVPNNCCDRWKRRRYKVLRTFYSTRDDDGSEKGPQYTFSNKMLLNIITHGLCRTANELLAGANAIPLS